jgi:hypothetical protein
MEKLTTEDIIAQGDMLNVQSQEEFARCILLFAKTFADEELAKEIKALESPDRYRQSEEN